ncbi:uncharacterized protein [Eucyclogobius newberryi]|uniref:uncharacterized protein isoform X2 n=1 Tax=Eucyclogobius newberryi TaxID=166745 RepID=UPI003B5B7272
MSDSPEEQPNNPGVLGRIGSWLWARNSTENASPTSPNHPGGAEQPDALTDDVFHSVPQDARQSTHTAEGQPSGEETAEDEWEEASSSFESGNLTANQNVRHLSHFSREVYGKSDSNHTQGRQAQTGKKLHVYLEETSVSGSAGQEVVSTKYAKCLQVRPKAKLSVSLDTEKGNSYSTALVGVNLKSQGVDHLEVGDEMGRKSARRRYRKNSQGEERSNVTQPDNELTDKSLTHSQRAKSPKSTSDNHASKTTPAPSPEVKSHSSGSDNLEAGQDLNSTLACGGAAVQEANMEGNESLYRVERKTETPESKRRSMKLSRSEVKLFTKNVPLRSEHSTRTRDTSDFKMVVRREGIKEETAADFKIKEFNKPEDKPKPATGRIADRIHIFENQKLGTPEQLDSPRSADVSPTRKPTGRLKAEFALSAQRSKSDECLDKKRSSSSSPPRNRVMTIKERVKTFNEACSPAAPSSHTQNISRFHRKVSASKSLELLDIPDEPDANAKVVSKVLLQLNGVDAKTSAGQLRIESTKVTDKEEDEAREATDATDSSQMPSRTGPRTKRRKDKELLSPKSETQTIVSTKQEINSLDGGQTDRGAMQVSDNVSQESQDELSGNVQDKMTTKQDGAMQKVDEKVEKIRSTNKIVENVSLESSKVDSLTITSKQQVSKYGNKDVANVDVRDNATKVDEKSSSEKPLRTYRESKVVSSQSQVASSRPELSGNDKESKILATPELKKEGDLSTEKNQGKPSEKVSSSRDKKLVESSSEEQHLHDNKSDSSTSTQLKEDSKVDKSSTKNVDKIVQPTVKSQQIAIDKGEKKKSNVKQAASSVIDKKVPEIALKSKDGTTQKAPRERNVDSTSVKVENDARSEEQKISDKTQVTTKTSDMGSSNEEQKRVPEIENKADVSKVKQEAAAKSGKEKLSDTIKDKKSCSNIEIKADLNKMKSNVEASSAQEKSGDKIEGITNMTDTEPSDAAQKHLPNAEKKEDLTNVEPKIPAKNVHKKHSVKKDTGPSDTGQKSVTNIENKVDLTLGEQEITPKSEKEEESNQIQVTKKAISSDQTAESKTVDKLQLSDAARNVAFTTELRKAVDKKDVALPEKSGEPATKESGLKVTDSSLHSEKARQGDREEKIAHLSLSEVETDTIASCSETKKAIHRDPVILPQKDQEITGPNPALFTTGTEDRLKDVKESLTSLDLPAPEKSKAGKDTELMSASKSQSKPDSEVAAANVIKPGVLEKCSDNTATQDFDTRTKRLGQEANVTGQEEKNVSTDSQMKDQDAKKQGKSSKIAASNALTDEKPVGLKNNAVSVEYNEGEREVGRLTIGPTALTSSTKISGKETLPKSASETKPRAKSVTAENKSPNGRDDSPQKAKPITGAVGGVLKVAKKDMSEEMNNADKVSSSSSSSSSTISSSNLDEKKSPQVPKDVVKQTGNEISISNTGRENINETAANGDGAALSKTPALKDEAAFTLKTSPETKFLNSSLKRHNFTKGRSKDDWSAMQPQDAPSSWLDVDFPKQKLRVSNEAKLTYSGSESNLLDAPAELDDEDFVEKIKKLCAPFSLPPRKHHLLRAPQPPFAMPAIKEARVEKTFDPEEFTFGLRKKNAFKFEMPSLLAKLQNQDGKASVKPARASLADRSMLLSGLESRFRDKTNLKDEEEEAKDGAKDEVTDEAKDEAKTEIKVKSRLEGSCVLSSLTTSSFRSKLSQSQAQAEGTDSGNVSPSGSPQQNSPQQPGPPPPCAVNTHPEASNKKEEIQCAKELVGSDSGPSLPTFNEIKLPDFLGKYLSGEAKEQRERAKERRPSTEPNMPTLTEGQSPPGELHTEADVTEPTRTELAQSTPGERPVHNKAAVKMPSLAGATEEPSVTTGLKLPDSLTNHFSGISLKDKAPPPPAPPKRRPSNKTRPAKGFHKRPGKMLLFEKAPFEGQMYEVHRDVEDATAMVLSALVSVRVVRGCWVLYEKPGFQGRTIALEEGTLELTNVWAQPGPELGLDPGLEPQGLSATPVQIGSIRLAVYDYSLPHIDLFTEPEGRGRVTPYHDDTIETGTFGIPLSTASIQVHSGVWLVFSDPNLQGMLAVLETGVYPFPEAWGFPSPFVGSLRPLKMGGFKVENPNEIKAVVFERAGFEGPSLETETDVFSFGEEEEGEDTTLQCVGSLKILGGLWLGYSEPGFEGQQYILEEGEYLGCEDWGGAEILSLRPIMADFMSPHLKMFSDGDFGALGLNIDLTVPVINMDETGYGLKTQSVDVLSGVWVVFEAPGFSGESFLLEKGQYGSPEDWGSTRATIASAMPVVLENFENTAKFKVQLFPEADFRGSAVVLEDSEGSLPSGFSVGSCKVLAGSWLAFEGQEFSGRMYVLDEGSYSDPRAMGCVHDDTTILSLQVAGFEFSLPSVVLFERSGLKGKRLVVTDGEVNLLMSGGGGRVQSVLVEGGMWVFYEEINYRGTQILLRPGEVTDWRSFSGWKKIGSLRPLLQKQVHFHIRSRQSRHLMTVTGDLDEIKLLRVQEMEESHGFEQIWFFQNGHLRCKLLEECCLCPSSSVTIAGARVGLTPALDDHTHLWSVTPEGVICYSGSPDLVLEVKGGHNYDKSQVILNTRDPKKPQQQWIIEVL